VDLDRQVIERRDFPIARRGYDAAAVDAHLRALAVEVDELQRTASSGSVGVSMASSAGTQVQSILEAAEGTAAEIERQANENARQLRETAERDAEQTRQEAIEKARAHVAAVAQAATALLERVGAMDNEVHALVDSLRSGAGRLATDLSAVESNMAALYDAAAGATTPAAMPAPPPAPAPAPSPEPAQSAFDAELAGAMAAPAAPAAAGTAAAASSPETAAAPAGEGGAPADASDVDGARLIALNMALNGESRADTERYLNENFKLADQASLIDEVYAAIEG
jgi:hypothetical protein